MQVIIHVHDHVFITHKFSTTLNDPSVAWVKLVVVYTLLNATGYSAMIPGAPE